MQSIASTSISLSRIHHIVTPSKASRKCYFPDYRLSSYWDSKFLFIAIEFKMCMLHYRQSIHCERCDGVLEYQFQGRIPCRHAREVGIMCLKDCDQIIHSCGGPHKNTESWMLCPNCNGESLTIGANAMKVDNQKSIHLTIRTAKPKTQLDCLVRKLQNTSLTTNQWQTDQKQFIVGLHRPETQQNWKLQSVSN